MDQQDGENTERGKKLITRNDYFMRWEIFFLILTLEILEAIDAYLYGKFDLQGSDAKNASISL